LVNSITLSVHLQLTYQLNNVNMLLVQVLYQLTAQVIKTGKINFLNAIDSSSNGILRRINSRTLLHRNLMGLRRYI